MPARRVLVVDDDSLVRWSLAERLRLDGHQVVEAVGLADAVDRLNHGVDLLLLNPHLENRDGLSVLRHIAQVDPDVVVILLSESRAGDVIGDALKSSVSERVGLPLDLDDVASRVSRGLDVTRLRRELRIARDALARPFGPGAIVGASDSVMRLKTLVRKVAVSSASTVLLSGDRGTGKHYLAACIHYDSSRAARPFLDVTCGTMPAAALAVHLFGVEGEDYGGSPGLKRGLFEQANEGTVLLDDVGALPSELQARVLRVLEEKTFRREGGTVDVPIDVRIITATSEPLDVGVRGGTFRADLYYRLNVLRIDVPALRQRGDDVTLLARHFADVSARQNGRPAMGLGPSAIAALRDYAWPGNVRELRNLVDRAVMLSTGEQLESADFDILPTARAHSTTLDGDVVLPSAGLSLEAVEKSLVVQALERTGGNQTRAAALLGLHRDQVRYRLEKFGLKS